MNELELAERDAYASLIAAAPADLSTRGAAVLRVAGAACIKLPDVPSTMLNRVLGLGVVHAAEQRHLDEIDAFFGATRYAIALAPHAQPPQLEEWLHARGFAPAYAWMKFCRGITEPRIPNTELRVEEVGASDAGSFGRVVTAAFGMPERLAALWPGIVGSGDWHCFIAYAADEPAAAGALYVREETGWFGAAGTHPAFRRRGGQSAIMAARMRKARELGLEQLVTETGERAPDRPGSSYGNILRFGFEEAYLRPNYESPERRAA